MSGSQIRFMSSVSCALIIVSVLLFLALPRYDTDTIFEPPVQDSVVSTGLSEGEPLGTFDRIHERADVVMIVETDNPGLWRTAVLDHYEDGMWTTLANPVGERLSTDPPVNPGAPTTTRTYWIPDIRATCRDLASVGNVVSVKELLSQHQIWLNQLHMTLSINSEAMTSFRTRYEVCSIDNQFIGSGRLSATPVRARLPSGLRTFRLEKDLYSQVPDNLSSRVRDLARSLTGGMNTVEEKVAAIQQYLGRDLEYSMDGLASGEMDPLEYFLFKSKKGHCEYFASAMVILLRCSGVHARGVRGFASGTYIDGQYVVKLKDAHMWTEVFYAGKGWRTHDPTPGQEERVVGIQHVGLIETLRLKWQTYVLQYDGIAQAELITAMKRGFVNTIERIVRGLVRNIQLLVTIAGTCVLIIAVFLLCRFARRNLLVFGPARQRQSGLAKTSRYFRKYLKALSRKGYHRDPGTTPNDLVSAMERDNVSIIDDARLLTELFYRTRFGGESMPADDQNRIKPAFARIKQWSKR